MFNHQFLDSPDGLVVDRVLILNAVPVKERPKPSSVVRCFVQLAMSFPARIHTIESDVAGHEQVEHG